MKRKEVLYVGVSVNPNDIKTLLVGSPFSEYPVKEEAHMTVCFRPDEEQLTNLLPLVGKEVELSIGAVGTLIQNGILMNVGLKVTTSSLKEVLLPATPHITVWINVAAKAKAVNTRDCQWTTPLSATLRGRVAVYNGRNQWAFSVE